MDDWEKTLKDLPAYQIYDILNSKAAFTDECSYCTYMYSYETLYTGITNFCCEMEKNLINLTKILDNIPDNTDRCRYFNF
ncbi:PIR Superfamily Protein [Plasmodium ovale curtisi]|uniref:PIR Superfamily Protein n=1 Tax=Plasmodium ovale curtisi TaxID=864141 RepID=A0A1A8WLW2_PLAOA|nr:PIR Superfamily Protein [Plasmodium ovale curtisi]